MDQQASSSSVAAATTATNSRLTTLDRSLVIQVLKDDDEVEDNGDGGDAQQQKQQEKKRRRRRDRRLHLWHGAHLLQTACCQLHVSPAVLATAGTLFHRYYHQISLQQSDVWSVAMACTLLATKLEELPKTISEIIQVYAHLYAERLLLLVTVKTTTPHLQSLQSVGLDVDVNDEDTGVAGTQQREREQQASLRSLLEKKYYPQHLGSFTTHLSPAWAEYFESSNSKNNDKPSFPSIGNNKNGPVYQEWHKAITTTENLLLRQLGFTVYWIADDSHPHKFLLYFCQVLEWQQSQQQNDQEEKDASEPKSTTTTESSTSSKSSLLVQCAWNYCNDASCYLDLCLRYAPEVIACAAILLTAKEHNVPLPSNNNNHNTNGTTTSCWWQVFIGREKGQELANAANAMAGLVAIKKRADAILLQSKCGDGGTLADDTDDTTMDDDDALDWLLATHGFVRSLVTRTADQETSFNDPNSYLWEYQKDVFEKQLHAMK